jgi:hypothetical protein
MARYLSTRIAFNLPSPITSFIINFDHSDRLWALTSRVERLDLKLITHVHIVTRFKDAWSCISVPPMRLHGMVLIQAQAQLYLARHSLLLLVTKSHFRPCLQG